MQKEEECSIAHGIQARHIFLNLEPEELIQQTLALGMGVLNDAGALCVHTGKFTGRSPKDRYLIKDAITAETVHWDDVNIPMAQETFDRLFAKVCHYVEDKDIWVRDVYACAHPSYRLHIRVMNETPWANLFCYNLFLRPQGKSTWNADCDWLILQVPSFEADPLIDGTRQGNFTIINFTRRIILIGGSAYTGEMKKGVFSALNFILPQYHQILSMHCAANEGVKGDVALFFGLSGTGKTTLSADSDRFLIGDDEHGWSEDSVFNFEGGCYAKVIGISPDNEPAIFHAIRQGCLLENVVFKKGSNQVNYQDDSITENTRASYPIHFIKKAKEPSRGSEPKNIFFLSCDAFGVFPPISKLSAEQAMYYFVSGYTAKVAGTEVGVIEPQATFSACFGRVFLPLHPQKYMQMLGEKLKKNKDITVWLVNTGWSGGPYGIGKRIPLACTRSLIRAAMNGLLDQAGYIEHPIFKLAMPKSCPNVPEYMLNPKDAWRDKQAYDKKAQDLVNLFTTHVKKWIGR